MTTIREGNAGPWWAGMIGDCVLCSGQWQLDKQDVVEYFDWLIDNNGCKYAAPRMACPTNGCKGDVHFHPIGER